MPTVHASDFLASSRFLLISYLADITIIWCQISAPISHSCDIMSAPTSQYLRPRRGNRQVFIIKTTNGRVDIVDGSASYGSARMLLFDIQQPVLTYVWLCYHRSPMSMGTLGISFLGSRRDPVCSGVIEVTSETWVIFLNRIYSRLY